MKKVNIILLSLLAMFLVSCATSTPAKGSAESPVSVATTPAEAPLPAWTSERLIEIDGIQYLIVSGERAAPWVELLTSAYQAALGILPANFVADHPRPAHPDFERGTLGWWKLQLPSKTTGNPVPPDPSIETQTRADQALQAGSVTAAVDDYVQAANQVMAAKDANSVARLDILLNKAISALGSLQLFVLPGEFQTKTGTAFAKPFQVRVTAGTTPVAGVALRFSAKLKKNGRLAVTGQSVLTDVEGVASFSFPLPDFSAKDEVVVVLDVNPWLEKLVGLPHELQDKLTELELVSANHRVSIPYSISSLSKDIPLSLAFADFDEKGALLKRGETMSALVAQLTKSGYTTSNNTMNLSLLKSRDDSTVLLAWLSQGKKSGRAVFGSAVISDVTTADKKVTVTVTGSLKVYDLETRKLVHQQKGGKVATGADRATAISAALTQLAADFVDVLNDELP